jgi:hypothetical protein
MSKSRAHRYASIDELRAALGPFATQSQSEPLPRSDVTIDSPDLAEGQSTSHVRTRSVDPHSADPHSADPHSADPHIAKTVINHQTPFPTPMPVVHPRGVELTPPIAPSLMEPPPTRRRLVVVLLAIMVGLVSIAGATLTGIYVGRSTSEHETAPPIRSPEAEVRPARPPEALGRETEVQPLPPPPPAEPPAHDLADRTPPDRVQPDENERADPTSSESSLDDRSDRADRSRVRIRRGGMSTRDEIIDPFASMTQSSMTQAVEPPASMIVLEPPRSMTDNLDPWAE